MANVNIKRLKRGWVGGKTELRISSPFGVWRKMPWYKKARKHNGIDISIPVGTPIYSPVDGTASCKFQDGGAGLYISINSKGAEYMFMHLSKSSISKGSSRSVKVGTLLGYSGGAKNDKNSGGSTGPHLHFEVRTKYGDKSSAINPVRIMSEKLVGKVKQNTIADENIIIPKYDEPDQPNPEELIDYDIVITQENQDEDNNQDVSDMTDWSETEDEECTEVELKEGYAAGIWQIIKMVMDSDVANLRLHDAATSVQAGTLISFFNKICQKPFVEFSGDTFGDQYYFIIRKPPFDREGMMKTMVAQGLYKDNTEAETDECDTDNDETLGDEVYVIHENDIINSSLSFNNQGIYSWYQFFPMYEMGAQSELQYIVPAVLFPEYASIYGSRELIVRSQYRNFISPDINDNVKNGEPSLRGDCEVRHSIHDLHYIIESNAYAPFVRNGTIQITGNRKMKRGMFIRVIWDSIGINEIFYIESVSNNYSVNTSGVERTTNLTLSHGMVEQYIFNTEEKINSITNSKGEDISDAISYFNIINFGDYEQNKENITMDKWSEIISSWKVNIDVFKFFLRKHQFISSLLTNVVVNN